MRFLWDCCEADHLDWSVLEHSFVKVLMVYGKLRPEEKSRHSQEYCNKSDYLRNSITLACRSMHVRRNKDQRPAKAWQGFAEGSNSPKTQVGKFISSNVCMQV